MKNSIFITFFVLLYFLSMNINPGYARLGPEDYWNKYVKDQYVPEAIEDMFRQDPAATSPGNDVNKMQRSTFARNFDPRRFDAVVYHIHHRSHPEIGNKPPSVQRFDKLKEDHGRRGGPSPDHQVPPSSPTI